MILHVAFCRVHTKTHVHEIFLSRLVPSEGGGGGGGKRSPGCGRTNSYAEIFWQKDFRTAKIISADRCSAASRVQSFGQCLFSVAVIPFPQPPTQFPCRCQNSGERGCFSFR